MRITAVFILFGLLLSAKASTSDEPAFKHHTFEFSATPAVDYYFITYSNRVPDYKQQVHSVFLPFVGCNFGLAYIYRPVKFIGISTGFNYLEYVAKMGKVQLQGYPGGPINFIQYNGYTQSGFIGVPILIHAYNQIKTIELDWATGPEFSFPIYSISKYSSSGPGGTFPEYINQTQLYSPKEMRQYSWLGWGVQVTASLPIKNSFYVSIGPEMKFLSASPLEPRPEYNQLAHTINYYTGIKVCFRLGADFSKKITKS
jgi:hypothetical protein